MDTLYSPRFGIFQISGGAGGALPPGQWSPVTLTNGEGGAVTVGKVVYLSAADTASLAFATGTEAQATAVAMVLAASIAGGATGDYVFGGLVAGAGVGHTFAEVGYLGPLGTIVSTPNLTIGQYNCILGFWQNATDFQFSPQIPILN